MGTFRCLVSDTTTNYNPGANLGTTTTTSFTLINTPLVAGTLSGTIYALGVAVNTFSVNSSGTFTIAEVGSPTNYVTAGSLNLYTGVLTFTWNNAPGDCYCIASYKGLPVWKTLTYVNRGVTCPINNQLCNPYSTAYIAATTVCSQHLYT